MPKTWQDDMDKTRAYDKIADMLKSSGEMSEHELLDNIRSEVFTDE